MELATALGIDEAELSAYQSQSQLHTVISLDDMSENSNGDEGLSLMERLPDPAAERPDSGVLSAEHRSALIECLAALPPAQATVITLHYLRNVPLREVAQKLKVTPSRVSQLHAQALERLRHSWQRAQVV